MSMITGNDEQRVARQALHDALLRRALFNLMWNRVEAGKPHPCPCPDMDDAMLRIELRRILGGVVSPVAETLTAWTMYLLFAIFAIVGLAAAVRLALWVVER